MLVYHPLDKFRLGFGLVAVDDTGWRRAVDQWEQVAELEIGEEAAAIP
jgi:hypothetical protein